MKKLLFIILSTLSIVSFDSFSSSPDEDEIIIRTWACTKSVQLPFIEGNYGHASLETEKYYISFWPTAPKASIDSTIFGVKGSLVASYSVDKKGKNGQGFGEPADEIISLTPNRAEISSINRSFESMLRYNNITWDKNSTHFETPLTNWLYKGRYGPRYSNNFYRYPQSCTTLVLNILGALKDFDPYPTFVRRPELIDISSFQKIINRYRNKS